MNASLEDFQRDFAHALLAPDAALPDDASPLATLARQPAFAVYRNTVMKGCIDALEANFPAVVRLVGRDWFRSAAALHVRAAPPRDARLLHYGEAFPAFLRDFPPAAALPYLPAVAELDRAWTDSHAAADACALQPNALAGLEPATLGALHLVPHPAARWRWFDDLPAYTLWSASRAADDAALADLHWRGEGSLLTRPEGGVQWCALDAAGCALMDACAAGASLADAAQHAQSRHGGDIAATLALLLRQGAFTG